MKKLKSVIFILAMFVTAHANATLIVDISGTEGTGETTISLSGSSVVTSGSNSFVASDGDDGAWFDFGDFIKSINNTNVAIIGGSASVDVNGFSAGIASIYLDQDTNGLDDWGFRILGTDLAVSLNDIISWSGSVNIGVDISEFNVGNYFSNDFGFGDATADVILNVTATEVPEAPILAMFFFGLLGLLRGRKQA